MAEAENIRANIYNCSGCKLRESNRVPFGGVTWAPKLILLGEAPGASEDAAGEPFVGRAGHILENMLAKVGLGRHHVMLVNSVNCRPPGNRDPQQDEIDACTVHRKLQIQLGRTWVGMTLGRIALSVIKNDPGIPIGAWKGRPFWDGDMCWVPTYHPAHVARNKGAEPEVIAHMLQALRLVKGEEEPPRPKGSGWRMERGCLILDHEDVIAPDKIVALARTTFTLPEWAKLKYSSKETWDAAILAREQLGATVVS